MFMHILIKVDLSQRFLSLILILEERQLMVCIGLAEHKVSPFPRFLQKFTKAWTQKSCYRKKIFFCIIDFYKNIWSIPRIWWEPEGETCTCSQTLPLPCSQEECKKWHYSLLDGKNIYKPCSYLFKKIILNAPLSCEANIPELLRLENIWTL